MWTVYVDMLQAKRKFVADVERLEASLTEAGMPPTETLLCITGQNNFRREILDSYKGHRKRKPPGYREFQDWILDGSGYKTFLRDGIEADDCLGILATGNTISGRKIIWSADKDLMQIPGLHLDADRDKIISVREMDGEILHAKQTLTGDVTDNYKGLPGFGAKGVEKLLEANPVGDMQDLPKLWEAVEAAFVKKGLTREDMLVQARVARILRATDYDFKGKQPIIWVPPESNE